MHGIYKIEEMLCEELNDIGEKGELTAGTLETVDKITHALKNTQKIIECYEEMGEYSNASGDGQGDDSYNMGSYARGSRGSRRGGRTRGANQYGSYARGGRRYNRYSNEGYSRAGGSEEMISELRELMHDSPDDKTRKEFERFIQKLEGEMM